MTLKEAERISGHVIKVMATKPAADFCRVSQLSGFSLPTISKAFYLFIAKQRQIGAYDPKLREAVRVCADKADELVGSLEFTVLRDEDVDRLKGLQRGSQEYDQTLCEALRKRQDQCAKERQHEVERESFASFDAYCWSLDGLDPLYWQKVYTHLELPYDENCPTGPLDVAADDHGKLAWQVKSVKERRKPPSYQFLLWVAGVIVLIWLVSKLAQ